MGQVEKWGRLKNAQALSLSQPPQDSGVKVAVNVTSRILQISLNRTLGIEKTVTGSYVRSKCRTLQFGFIILSVQNEVSQH